MVLSIHFAGRILVFHVQFLMERRHDNQMIVQLSAHEMQRTRMLCVLGRFVADQLLPSEVSIYILYFSCIIDTNDYSLQFVHVLLLFLIN